MNDERPIEKLLRRYAKKRREDAGAPMEMHPATRRLLQGEVARQYRQAGAGKTSSTTWWGALRQRWIYVTAVTSTVVIAALLFYLNGSLPPQPLELAKQNAAAAKVPAEKATEVPGNNLDGTARVLTATDADRRAVEAPVNVPALAPPEKQKSADEFKRAESVATTVVAGTAGNREEVKPAPAPVVGALAFDDKEVQLSPAPRTAGEKSVVETRYLSEPVATATPVPATTPAPLGRAASGPARTRTTTTDSLAAPKASKDLSAPSGVPAAPPPASSLAARAERSFAPIARGGGLERDRQAGRSQSFANVPVNPKAEAAFKTEPTTPVLLHFEVVQSGNQWQVIDADGSTYFGEPAAEPARANEDATKGARALKKQTKVATDAGEAETTPNAFYRVSGTNRTLNQQVVFTWNFVAPTNQATRSPAQAVGGILNSKAQNNTQQSPGLYNNSGIVGRAQINSSKEFEIRATPVKE